MAIGEKLQELRRLKSMSMTELASVAEVSKSYLWELETGKQTNPSLEVLQRLAEALDVTIGELLGTPAVRAAIPAQDASPDAGLDEFLRDRKRQGVAVPEKDVQVLMQVQAREGRRRSKEDWAFFYRSWKMWSENR